MPHEDDSYRPHLKDGKRVSLSDYANQKEKGKGLSMKKMFAGFLGLGLISAPLAWDKEDINERLDKDVDLAIEDINERADRIQGNIDIPQMPDIGMEMKGFKRFLEDNKDIMDDPYSLPDISGMDSMLDHNIDEADQSNDDNTDSLYIQESRKAIPEDRLTLEDIKKDENTISLMSNNESYILPRSIDTEGKEIEVIFIDELYRKGLDYDKLEALWDDEMQHYDMDCDISKDNGIEISLKGYEGVRFRESFMDDMSRKGYFTRMDKDGFCYKPTRKFIESIDDDPLGILYDIELCISESMSYDKDKSETIEGIWSKKGNTSEKEFKELWRDYYRNHPTDTACYGGLGVCSDYSATAVECWEMMQYCASAAEKAGHNNNMCKIGVSTIMSRGMNHEYNQIYLQESPEKLLIVPFDITNSDYNGLYGQDMKTNARERGDLKDYYFMK